MRLKLLDVPGLCLIGLLLLVAFKGLGAPITLALLCLWIGLRTLIVVHDAQT